MFHLKRQPRRCRSTRSIHCRQGCHCSASTHAVPAHGHCTMKCCLRSFRKHRRQPRLSPVDNDGTLARPTSVVAIAARVRKQGSRQLSSSRTGRVVWRRGRCGAPDCFETILLRTFALLAISPPPPRQSLFFLNDPLAVRHHSPLFPLRRPSSGASC